MAFGADLAKLAMSHGITPRTGMATFGHLAGLLVAHEYRKQGGDINEWKVRMMDIFTQALERGIADALTNTKPPSTPQ